VVSKVAEILNEDRIAVNGAHILVLGVAYKPDVSDMRESPAIDVIRLLAERGGEVSYHDPHVPEIEVEGITYKSADLSDDRLADADIVVIITDHAEVDWARVVARAGRIFDTRNATRNVAASREKVRKL
jgi:UDP-N-acetyl-D-glucosamine dehydrogenase